MAELPDWDFDKVRADARKTWNDCLSKIEVKTEDPDQLAIFYTAMYHAFLSPNLFTDVDGRYLGMDLKVHTTDKEDPVYTTFFYLGHISCVASFAHHHRPSYQRKLYPFIVEETA